MTHSQADYSDIVDELRAQEWEISLTPNGHYKAKPPDKDKPIVHFATTTKTHSRVNTLKSLQRSGFRWPPVVQRRAPMRPPSEDPPLLAVDEEPVEVPPSEPPPPPRVVPPPPAPPSLEAQLESIWSALKEARSFVALTDEHLRERCDQLTAASKAFEEAKREHKEAEAALVARKAEFDAAFEAGR